MSWRLWFAGTVAVLLTAGLQSSAGERGEAERGLLSVVPLERQAAYDRILAQRTELIRELVSIIEREDLDKAFYGPVHQAVVLLGELRAVEAAEPLCKLLLYIPDGFIVREIIPSQAYYVAAVALVQIGNPAIPAMLAKISQSPDKTEREIATWVIMRIEGEDQALHRFAVLIESGGPAAERYEGAKHYVETYVPTFDNPASPHRAEDAQ